MNLEIGERPKEIELKLEEIKDRGEVASAKLLLKTQSEQLDRRCKRYYYLNNAIYTGHMGRDGLPKDLRPVCIQVIGSPDDPSSPKEVVVSGSKGVKIEPLKFPIFSRDRVVLDSTAFAFTDWGAKNVTFFLEGRLMTLGDVTFHVGTEIW